jgi:hypothetical protein
MSGSAAKGVEDTGQLRIPLVFNSNIVPFLGTILSGIPIRYAGLLPLLIATFF